MSDQPQTKEELYDLLADVQMASKDAVSFWKKVVEAGTLSLRSTEPNAGLINAAMKASQNLVSYSHGLPKQAFSIDGKLTLRKEKLDATKLSTSALKEILAARESKSE